MKTIFFDNFKSCIQNQYPYNWGVEINCENPNNLAWVDNGEFYILYSGNKHFPLIPPLKDFSLEFRCRGDRFFSPLQLLIFFRYSKQEQTGYCLNYKWGISGNQTQFAQVEEKTYKIQLCRYYGKRIQQQFEVIAEKEITGFCRDLSELQDFQLKASGNIFKFYHNSRKIAEFQDRENVFTRDGLIAFDRIQYFKSALSFSSVTIKSPNKFAEQTILPKQKIEFPAFVNGIISPYYFHFAVFESAGRKILKTRLTGGPSKEVLPDIDRCRFNEKMYDPYIRIESADGCDLGKFYIYKGSVGLDEFSWNVKTSVMLPADCECPCKRNFYLEELPEDVRFFIGYEKYIAEDSICLAGGPSEALIAADGTVLYAGEALNPSAIVMITESPKDKEVCARIPKDIPNYEDALTFARNNFFFYVTEKPRFGVKIFVRDNAIGKKNLFLSVTLENVFKEPLQPAKKYPLHTVESEIVGTNIFSSGFICLDKLPVGVFHIRLELFLDQMKIKELHRTFEVMPDELSQPSAPIASGLPKLYANILSGIKNEHFFPWGSSVSDTAHYSCGGNNFFKVSRDLQPWELLHIYGREWLCWLQSNVTVFEKRGIEANTDLIKNSDACLNTIGRVQNDLWVIGNYKKETVYNALLAFLNSDKFKPIPKGCLSYEKVFNSSLEGITPKQFHELINFHWKDWICFFANIVTGQIIPEKAEKIRTVNPNCKVFEFCPVYPTYASVYKAGYFPFYFGKNLRGGLEKSLDGPNGFEDYPYSSRYAISRGVYQLMSCKLENPKLILYPEMFGINGETLDSHVVYAHPPYGQSDPPPGFLTKQFYEYSFATCWFDTKGFNFWDDHGYYIKTWDRDNYDEMLNAYSFISKAHPQKPLRTSAFVFSLYSCMEHPDYYEQNEELFNNGYIFNTAEESVAFAYEQARRDGQLAGFVIKMEDVERLDSKDIDMLVLPPLCGVNKAELTAIRKLHEQGVSILGFEDASGLEDIFGVEDCTQETQITEISVHPDCALSGLQKTTEKTEHPLCCCRYRAASGSKVLLAGNKGLPVLLANRTNFGKTAFFTIPPTVVRRAKAHIATYGQESISELINQATALVMRYLGNPQVETTSGKSIAFKDEQEMVHVIVSEDAWPQLGKPIFPEVTIKLPNVKMENIVCNKEFSIVEITSVHVKVRLRLTEHESAKISIGACRRSLRNCLRIFFLPERYSSGVNTIC